MIAPGLRRSLGGLIRDLIESEFPLRCLHSVDPRRSYAVFQRFHAQFCVRLHRNSPEKGLNGEATWLARQGAVDCDKKRRSSGRTAFQFDDTRENENEISVKNRVIAR
jgi:hypothetical protein